MRVQATRHFRLLLCVVQKSGNRLEKAKVKRTMSDSERKEVRYSVRICN